MQKQGTQQVFVTCKFFEVIVTEIVKVIVMPRTKRGKILFDEKVKGSLLPPLSGRGRHYTCAERLLVGQKSRDNARS